LSARASTLAPLAYGNFRTLWLATLVSNLGGLIQGVGAGWVMTTMTESYNMVALVQAATTLPIMIFSIAAGALADSFDRRRIMLAAQVLMTVISLGLAVLTFMGLLTPWLLLAVTFLIGCGTALHNPSWQASLGDLLPRKDLPSAVALNSMSFNLMRSVGPAIGGIVVTLGGVFAAFGLNAVSYLPLIWALTRWRPDYPAKTLPRERFGSAMGAGVRYVFMSPKLLAVLFRGFVFGLAAISVLALLPSVASQYLASDALGYGTLLGSFGAGAIGGAFLSAQLRARLRHETIIRIACIGFAVSCAALGLSRNSLLSHLALLPAGACWVLALSLFNMTIQLSTPRWVVGRVLSLYQTATFGGMALGSWLFGFSADVLGLQMALIGAGIVLLVCALMGLALPLPEFGEDNLDPLDTFREPLLRLDLRSRSGPILIVVDYIIDQQDIPAFLRLMAERRRIRLRDGARNWALLRDLENPEVWSESYHVATWLDYVRLQGRRTQVDAENFSQILRLHRGDERPRVSRKIERQTVPTREDLTLRKDVELP